MATAEEWGRMLTPTMDHHLAELLEAPYWRPQSSGEWSCARAMHQRGLVSYNPTQAIRPFALTELGRQVGLVRKGMAHEPVAEDRPASTEEAVVGTHGVEDRPGDAGIPGAADMPGRLVGAKALIAAAHEVYDNPSDGHKCRWRTCTETPQGQFCDKHRRVHAARLRLQVLSAVQVKHELEHLNELGIYPE